MLPIEPKAAEWVEDYIGPNMVVFEYGSGQSTIYFANRVKKVITIELCTEKFEKYKQYNPHTYFVLPIKEERVFPYSHESYGTTDKEFEYYNFEKYVNSIKKFRNNYFDIVFINGRSRASCIMTVIPKVKKGGIIILNDSERYVYQDAKELFLKEYPHQEFGEGTRKTSIWNL